VTRKQRRLTLIFGALILLGLAAGLMLFALRDTVVFFFTPSELVTKTVKTGARLRIGGLVKPGSVDKQASQKVSFIITDGTGDLAVDYTGLLPDLFREGQGVIVEGSYPGHEAATPIVFHADSVLAKHDERYMPREVAESLKAKGLWQANKAGAP
jgi:cytochrome c-type biogenesis protein CcmE